MKKILLQIVFFLSATIAMAQTDIQFSDQIILLCF